MNARDHFRRVTETVEMEKYRFEIQTEIWLTYLYIYYCLLTRLQVKDQELSLFVYPIPPGAQQDSVFIEW